MLCSCVVKKRRCILGNIKMVGKVGEKLSTKVVFARSMESYSNMLWTYSTKMKLISLIKRRPIKIRVYNKVCPNFGAPYQLYLIHACMSMYSINYECKIIMQYNNKLTPIQNHDSTPILYCHRKLLQEILVGFLF